MESDRIRREKSYHDQRFRGDDKERISVRKYYSVNKHVNERYFEIVSELCEGKNLLEYGCGSGNKSEQWLKLGARVTGIDISEEGIKKAKESITDSEFQAEYYVMDAEDTTFNDGSFDIIVGSGILHHLDLTKSYQELSRICNSDGHIVFLEPLGHNPLINLIRLLTPKMRTEDEHPLKLKDIKLLNQYFKSVDIEYYALFTLFTVPIRNMLFFEKVSNFFIAIDKTLFSIPFMKRYAWMVFIHASKPIN